MTDADRAATVCADTGGADPICAAVDVGSNSAHVLVARVPAGEGALEPLLDESVILGLGAVVDGGAAIGEARAGLLEVLGGYAARARELGATRIAFIGTEPLRRAGDARAVVDAVARVTGVAFHVLTHEEEGLLTLIGATGGRPAAQPFAVADIGGGSSEIVFAGGGAAPHTVGLRIGSTRLARAVGIGDPPTVAELAVLRAAARAAINAGTADVTAAPGSLIAVGGTAGNLAKLLPAVLATGHLDRAALAEAYDLLASAPADLLGPPRVIRPQRIRQLPAGAAILEAFLDRFGLGSATVTEHGIREGLCRALALAGDGWRDRLPALAAG